jgi:uncharacterized membrane protein
MAQKRFGIYSNTDLSIKMGKLITCGLIAILLLFLIPLLHTGIFLSHDGITQIVRIASYSSSILNGVFPVRWAPELNYGYGTPLLIFIYPLPYYLGVFVHVLGFNFQNTYKILLASSFLLSFHFFYLWISQNYSKKVAVVSAFIYVLMPHHFLDLYVRGALGDVIGFALIPLCFYSIEKIFKKSQLFILIGGIAYGLLILSHNGLSLIFTPIFLAYIFLRAWDKRIILYKSLLIFPVGLLISLFFWAPALLENSYMSNIPLFEYMYKNNFSSIIALFYSPWGFGVDVSQSGGLSPQIGIINLLLLLFSVLIFKKLKNVERKMVFLWSLVFFVSIFLSISQSTFFYENIGLLRKFQFPWRFLILAGFACASVSPVIVSKLKIKQLIILLIVLLIYSTQFVSVKGYINYPDSYYSSFNSLGFDHGEGITKWTSADISTPSKSRFELIGGKAVISDETKNPLEQKLKIDAKSQIQLLDNTIYFPGWRVMIDDKKTLIEFQDMNHRGLITFYAPQGVHNVSVSFKESPVRLIADWVSLFFSISIFIILIYYLIIKLVRQNK